MLENKQIRVYLVLVSLVICGLAAATVTASKVVHFGLDFPFSNIIFSVLTFPIIDSICEIWGKRAAQQAVLLAVFSQLVITGLLQLSIVAPHADYWQYDSQYRVILSSSLNVAIASSLAFLTSQVLDITVYQKIRQLSRGRWLWLRTNFSTFVGQFIDSSIFISVVFGASSHTLSLILGSVAVKACVSILMTPFIYLIVYGSRLYLGAESGGQALHHLLTLSPNPSPALRERGT